ncbi:LysR family transcriptional regulator [Xanthomonas graminis]|uniref:Transcriptional regulator n=1 Tax=Xanthomonas graminis pv. graminis TaxID=134874 RepID=A0A1M4JDG6_9XANT|nr:LysR family transcriptional regulator [Xanthomonas translucens]EKU25730.1 transcriptional regulator, LysR family [Xanthomonas translucens pv. graminis ART-Xtg29]OAX63342.1 LysR family transcriptional regulator [Xanthomonas translucens pv. graminis]UKE54710.1 LysR family transcriptional regulator [Xanthomonas translucens pv. graminis]WIH08577.1 LysR family transcriptional regulator [Xanthomonas translucens pv. graminis]WIH11908.1 LysR family transcriptional regulator [Xanthomonas translucens
MDTLEAMRVFVTVVDRNGFNSAAEALGMSTASVTRQVAWLEKRLGLRLLNRTTRRVSPSSVGTAYYQRCQVLLAEFDDMEAAVGEQALTPSGTLRINAPFSFSIARLGPRLAGYRARYPQVALDLSLSDRMVDIVEEGYDMAIRITRQVTPTLIARKLGEVQAALYAAPAYLQRAGTPRLAADIAGHEFLTYSYMPLDEIALHGPDGETRVRVQGGLRANSGDVLREAAIAGMGIVLQPDFIAQDALQDGRLVRVLPEHRLGPIGVYAVYASRSHLAPKVRSFIDYLVEVGIEREMHGAAAP